MEDEVAKDPVLVEDLHSDNTSPAPSCNPTLGPNLVLALIPVPLSTLTLAPVDIDELFKKFMKAYLETNQRPKQPPVERKQTFKAKLPEVYYDKSHIDCYHFCHQCKDYFKTTGATEFNRTLFATFFLRGNISVRWTQFKYCNQNEELTSITWTEFKAFLQKNFGESKSFVDSIWRNLKKDSQYQLEEVYNWASQLKHLVSILLEFDPVVAPTEVTMVRYFEESLKPSIKAEINQDNSQLINYEELVTKPVRAKAKASLRPSFYVWETDLSCLQGNWLAHTTIYKVRTQRAVKNHREDDLKTSKGSASTPASASIQESEPSKKDKKKKYYRGQKNSRELNNSSILASGVNVAEVGGGR